MGENNITQAISSEKKVHPSQQRKKKKRLKLSNKISKEQPKETTSLLDNLSEELG